MARVRVSVTLDAPPARVWDDIQDLASHVEWMGEAVAIRFIGHQRTGTGTRFECDTEVGPIRLTDVLEITRWEPGRIMGVRHIGVVTGDGEFRLQPDGPDRTRFVWDERLRFPWWLGGPIGAFFGARVLWLVWRRNLRTLQRRIAAP